MSFNKYDYIIDLKSIKENAFSEAKKLVLENGGRFNKYNISKDPVYAWLEDVDCILKAPSSGNIEEQKKELDSFIEELKSLAFYLEFEHLPKILPKNYKEPVLGFDTETTGLDTRTMFNENGEIESQSLLVGVSLAVSETLGWYLPIRHVETSHTKNWNKEIITSFLSRLNMEFCLIIHNASYDRQVLALNGVKDFRDYPYFFDTQILYYLLNTDQNRYGLKPLSESVLKRKMIDIWDLFPGNKSVDFLRFDFLKAEDAVVYACSDAVNTFSLFKKMTLNDSPTNPLFFQDKPVEIDHKLIDTLIFLCRCGFPVDVFYCIEALKDTSLRIELVSKEIHKLVGFEFDIGSPKQLSEIIFNTLKIPPLEGMELNKSGYYSVDEDNLDSLQQRNPNVKILSYVVFYRKLVNASSKFFTKFIKNSYVDYLIPYSRIYLSFSQTRTTTGRLASSSNGSLDDVIVKPLKPTKNNPDNFSYKFVLSDGTFGGNSQGISATHYRTAEANELIDVPKEVLDCLKDIEGGVEESFIKHLTT